MRKIILFIFLILSPPWARAQQSNNYLQQIDSLKKLPESFLVCKNLGDIYQKTGNYKMAISYFQKANEKKNDKQIQKKLASLWRAKGYPEKAVEILEKIIQKDSLDLSTKVSLAKLYLILHEDAKAKAILKKLEQKDPENPWYTYHRAQLIKDILNHKLDTYLLAYRKDTTWIKPIYAISQLYNKIKFYDSAYYYIKKGLSLRPTHSKLLKLKVKEEYRQKSFKKMNHTLKYMDSLNKDIFFTNKMLGLNYYLLKKYPVSLKALDKALIINPIDPDLYLYKSYVYFAQKKYKKAENMIKISLNLRHIPEDKEYYQLGLIAAKQYKYKKAIGLFNKAYKENSKNSEALFQWAFVSDLYYKDKKIALQRYQKFKENDSHDNKEQSDFAKERIKELKMKLFMGEK